MNDILQYSPGMKVTVFLETKDGYGARADGYALPSVTRIVLPDLTLATGYPQSMIALDTGLYYIQYTLPTGAAAIGSYLIDVTYINPIDSLENTKIYQVIVSAPFGSFSTTIGN